MECEYFPEFHAFYEDELLGRRGYDYLIGAGHYTPLEGSWQNSFANMDQPKMLNAYSRHLAEIMESGLFAFIAHPDLFGWPRSTKLRWFVIQMPIAPKTHWPAWMKPGFWRTGLI